MCQECRNKDAEIAELEAEIRWYQEEWLRQEAVTDKLHAEIERWQESAAARRTLRA